MPAVLVVLNPKAGGGRAKRLAARIAHRLAVHAPQAVFFAAPSIDAARERIAALPAGSRVVAVGGDGTLHQLLQSIHAGQHTLGVVPAGSGNDMARAFGVFHLGWRDALQLAVHGAPSPIDLGRADWTDSEGWSRSALFASSLTAGFDSSVVLRADHGPRWLYGLPRYLLATLREVVALRNWPLRVRAGDAVLHDGQALFCSTLNTRTFGSGMPAVPHARIDDAQLDLLVAGRFGRAATLMMLPRLLAGWHLGHDEVRTHALASLQIEATDARQPVPLAADGEYLGEARQVQVHCLPGALSVVRKP